jgi:vitamin B12 transporter
MKRLLSSVALLPLLYAPAYGQSNPDDEIITVASRVGGLAQSELTSPASTISSEELLARSNTYVADYLRTVPGASINRSGPAGGLTQLRLRGTEANQVLVLIDGVEVSNPNTGEFDFASLRSEDVIKIEVLRGEQSALWGSDAIGGVVNIITRSGSGDANPAYQLSLEGGSFNTAEAQISANIPLFDGAALSVNGNLFTTDGYDVSGLGGGEDGAKSRALNLGLNNVQLGDVRLSAKFSAQKANNEFDSDTNFDGRLNDINAETETDTQIAGLSARFSLAGFDHLVNLNNVDTEQVTTGTSFQNDTTGRRTAANWAAEGKWNIHSLTLLAETENENFSNFGGIGGGQNQDESISNHALAADYRLTTDTVTLSGSVRQDFNDRFDNSLTWRVGTGYAFNDFGGRIRASLGTGVKNPTLTELFGFFPAFFVGNPGIKPEKSLGYNIGYEQKLLNDNLKISVDYFRSDLEDEIFTDFSVFPSTVQNRTTDSKREGIEVETRWKISQQLSARGSATFLDAEENGVPEPRRPEFLASGTLTWNADPFSLTLSADHTGSQFDTDFGSFIRVELDSYTLVGLNARFNLNETISLSLRAENLLDEDYQEVVGYTSQGRGIYAGLRADF